MIIYKHYHNFRKLHRQNSAKSERKTHAEAAGLNRKSVQKAMAGVYSRRAFFSHSILDKFSIKIWFLLNKTPEKETIKQLPVFVSA
ncbi:MAG: hypothetical protein HQ557_09295 [Bacteroidetes bacterium]|nr:hypothetical protein [Bacteroidota bacterium]